MTSTQRVIKAPHRAPRIVAALPRGLALTTAVLVAVVPFLYVVSSALKSQTNLFTYPPQWIPNEPTLRNFSRLFESEFVTWGVRTLFVTSVITGVKLVIDSMAAFAFAKMNFPGRRTLFGAMLITVMVPPIALIIPLYFMIRDLDGINSYWALIIPPMANPIGIFMLVGFIRNLPDELTQAGRIDGATFFQLYRKVILPVIKPGLVVVGLYTFLLQYSSFIWPLVIAPERPLFTTGLASLKGQVAPDWGLLSAGALAVMVPITAVFLLFQRQFLATAIGKSVEG